MYSVFEYETEHVALLELHIRRLLQEYRQKSNKDMYVLPLHILLEFVQVACDNFRKTIESKNKLIKLNLEYNPDIGPSQPVSKKNFQDILADTDSEPEDTIQPSFKEITPEEIQNYYTEALELIANNDKEQNTIKELNKKNIILKEEFDDYIDNVINIKLFMKRKHNNDSDIKWFGKCIFKLKKFLEKYIK